MKVHLKLAGFGADRPAAFRGRDETDLELAAGASLSDALAAAGLDGLDGLSVLVDEKPVPRSGRDGLDLKGGETVTVLYALEGG
jgi:sulfur carrier protein ThiS